MDLQAAAGLVPGDVVAFVGAGGKTTAMFVAARELAAGGHRVVTTSTTKIWPPTADQSRLVIVERAEGTLLESTHRALRRESHVTVVSSRTDEGKLQGVPPSTVGRLAGVADFVLVEADGARGHSLKAPADYEPVIPASTTVVIPVAAIDAVGRRLTDEVAHRPSLVSRVTGLHEGAVITPDTLASLLTSPQGALKAIPDTARAVLLLNKVETEAQTRLGRVIARSCLDALRVDRVLLGAVAGQPPVLERWQRVSAVILAAGESRRFGSAKQLLPLGEGTLLGHVLHQVRSSWVAEVVVVLGHAAEGIERALRHSADPEGTSWRVVIAEKWAEGLSASLRAGLAAIAPDSDAVLFALGDQPDVHEDLLNEALIRYASTGAPIVATEHDGRLSPPVVFHRSLFDELGGLSGHSGGREVLRRHLGDVERVVLPRERPFRDIDTPKDYEAFLGRGQGRQ